MKTDAVKKKDEELKWKAWNVFKSSYPNADLSQLHVETDVKGINDVTRYVQFRLGYWSNVIGPDVKYMYFSEKKNKALGTGGFPNELTLHLLQTPVIPRVSYSDVAEPFAHLSKDSFRFYITPSDYFTIKFREINTIIINGSHTEWPGLEFMKTRLDGHG